MDEKNKWATLMRFQQGCQCVGPSGERDSEVYAEGPRGDHATDAGYGSEEGRPNCAEGADG
jgi:hypothetical protein